MWLLCFAIILMLLQEQTHGLEGGSWLKKWFDEGVYMNSERARHDHLFDLYSSLWSGHLASVALREHWPACGRWHWGICWCIGAGRTIAFSPVVPLGTASPSAVWGNWCWFPFLVPPKLNAPAGMCSKQPVQYVHPVLMSSRWSKYLLCAALPGEAWLLLVGWVIAHWWRWMDAVFVVV